MNIEKLSVVNFRGLRDFQCDSFADVVLFCGRNNCGKTTLLEAIDLLCQSGVGSTITSLNLARCIQPTNWESVLTAFSDMDANRCIEIAVGYPDDVSRTVSVRLEKSKTVQFSGDRDRDDLMSKRLSMTTKEKSGETEHTTQSSFYWTPGGVNVGDIARPGWVSSNADSDPKMRCVFLPSTVQSDVCIRPLRDLINGKRVANVVSVLAKIDSRIKNLAVDDDAVKVDVDGATALLPIQVLGDGMLKILNALMAIEVCERGGVVLMDEVDNGLHYSAYMNFIRVALDYARQKNVQLIMTTHSHEFLSRLARREEFVVDLQRPGRFAYNNLIREPDGRVVCESYTFNQFRSAVESGMEVR